MKLKSILILVLFLGAIGFVVFKLVFGRSGAVAGLKITATPQASVYLDDKLIGKTPYDGRHPAGNYVLKLTADEGGTSWQDKIVLTASTLTYVKKELGTSELTTAGEAVYLEKIGQDEVQLSVASSPDAAVVSVDGMEKGITPINLPILEGEHDVVVNSTGFVGRTVKIKAVKGYRITVISQLALSSESTANLTSPTPVAEVSGKPTGTANAQSSPDEPAKPYVIIKETPTNFLRVRLDASLSASEVAQLQPGTRVPFKEEKSGWFKVTYEEGKDGWISSRYAEKVE